MRIRWTPDAVADLQQISEHLRSYHPHYRLPTLRKVYDTLRALAQHPHRGRPGREEGTREILFLPLPYIAVYRVTDQAVQILRVYHTAQNRS